MDLSIVNNTGFREFFKNAQGFEMPHDAMGSFTEDLFNTLSHSQKLQFLDLYEKYLSQNLGTLDTDQVENFKHFQEELIKSHETGLISLENSKGIIGLVLGIVSMIFVGWICGTILGQYIDNHTDPEKLVVDENTIEKDSYQTKGEPNRSICTRIKNWFKDWDEERKFQTSQQKK
jgi:hypothetical protein